MRSCISANGIRLLSFLAFDGFPLEEAIDREDAAPSPICLSECWQSANGLAFGVNRLATTSRILTPARNEAPPERVERELAGLVITPDHQEVLAWRAVPARRIVVDAAITDVHSVHDAYRIGALLWMTLPHMMVRW
jgi:hypothetical protein